MTKQHFQLKSTALKSGTYDDELQQLEITFASGESYTFDNVPSDVAEGLRDAGSPGSYYHANIKGRY